MEWIKNGEYKKGYEAFAKSTGPTGIRWHHHTPACFIETHTTPAWIRSGGTLGGIPKAPCRPLLANSARNRSMHDISKRIIHCMHAFNMRGAVHNTVSFGTQVPTDPGQLMPTEHAAAAVANDLSVIKEENKRVKEDRSTLSYCWCHLC